jgi:hypothetical protein
MSTEIEALRDMRRLRLETHVMRVLDELRRTIRLEPYEDRAVSPPIPAARRADLFVPASLDDVRVEFTDESVRLIAPFVAAADVLGGMQAKHFAALRQLILDYIAKAGYIEEFYRVIPQDTVTIEELMLLVVQTADHAELLEASQR